MQKKIDKSLILLLFGIIMAILAGVLIVKGNAYYNQLVPVVYVNQIDIKPNAVIKEEDLVIVEVPKIAKMDQNTYSDKADVVGKIAKTLIPANTTVAKSEIIDLKQGGSLLSTKLSQIGDPEVLAYTIPTNQVSAVGGKIVQNDTVHIIASFDTSLTNGAAKQRVSKIIVPYAKVLDTVGKDANIRGVTFALTAQQIMDVEYAEKNGTISFAVLPYIYDKNEGNVMTTEDTFIKRHFEGKVK